MQNRIVTTVGVLSAALLLTAACGPPASTTTKAPLLDAAPTVSPAPVEPAVRVAATTARPTRRPAIHPQTHSTVTHPTATHHPTEAAHVGTTSKPKPTATVTARHYANCTSLHADYPHGLGRANPTDHVSGSSKPVTTFARNTAAYNAAIAGNADLDRDHDGVACEQR